MKRSLHIGINNYPGTNMDLAGCVNDANDWRAAMEARSRPTPKCGPPPSSSPAARTMNTLEPAPETPPTETIRGQALSRDAWVLGAKGEVADLAE